MINPDIVRRTIPGGGRNKKYITYFKFKILRNIIETYWNIDLIVVFACKIVP